MASDIEIEVVNLTNFEKIQKFLNDTAYKEILENSENFNTRLCIERRLRMPFIDPQTGVAQNHCALFMKQKQRMPGFRDGQIYTYPSSRWRKPKRQYLLHHQSYKAFQFRETYAASTPQQQQQQMPQPNHLHQGENSANAAAIDSNSMGATADTDSKDSHPMPEKEWYYDEMELSHVDDFEEDFESDNMDFDESYNSRNRKKRSSRMPRKSTAAGESTPKRRGGRGGKRKNPEKPEEQKRRSNITFPTTNATSSAAVPLTIPEEQQQQPQQQPTMTAAVLMPETKIPVDVDEPEASPKKHNKMRATERGKAQPSPYCDFCLGDARENKKTNLPEELVSCSDCGRSGHPTCLQFTPNMIISVKRYRWQCIECKYCSICGTSDNDDQLLFCDDCDRGYHMYCLSPPLTTPPEGSWSCKLCLEEFHSGRK